MEIKECFLCNTKCNIRDGFLHCHYCNSLFCIRCLSMKDFTFDEIELLYRFRCVKCILDID